MPEKQEIISQAHLAAGRAVDCFRRQLGIVLEEDSGALLGACPVEGLTPKLLAGLGDTPRTLLLAGARARSLGFDAKEKTVCFNAAAMPLAELQALADPLAKDAPAPDMKPQPATPPQELLLAMAKYASLLPALLLVESGRFSEDWLRVTESDIRAYWDAPPLDIVPLAQAALPIEGTENAVLTCYRQRYGTSVHLALVVGDAAKVQAPLVRIHSSCVTGDLLGSLRCDCGDQLKLALEEITAAGQGILIYLHQEGRGIGFVNKLRAYALQERGVDTYEANAMLGFGEDERDFAIAGAIVKKLGVKKIRLMTNNPQKLTAIEKSGIKVTERVPLIVKTGRHNHAYLQAKSKKAGHLF